MVLRKSNSVFILYVTRKWTLGDKEWENFISKNQSFSISDIDERYSTKFVRLRKPFIVAIIVLFIVEKKTQIYVDMDKKLFCLNEMGNKWAIFQFQNKLQKVTEETNPVQQLHRVYPQGIDRFCLKKVKSNFLKKSM